MRNRWRDLVFGLRLLLKNPGFTAVAVLALALGIGANTAIFSVVYATLLAPLPYNDPGRIVMVWSFVNNHRNGSSAGDFLDWHHEFHWLLVMARLKPGVTVAQATSNMQAVTKHIAETYPKSNQGWSATVEPLQNDFLDRDDIRALWLLLGAVGFVLLIACANVANLLLARGTARQREIAVRGALGASPGRLFGQFLTESVTLAGIGGALGILLAWGLLKAILAMMPPFTLPSEADVTLNIPVLLFTIGATMLSGVLFGCAPAFQAMRLNLNKTLKEGGRGGSGGGKHRVRYALVLAEFALALTLLGGAGIAIHSVWKITHVDMGFRTDHILTFGLPMPSDRLKTSEQITAFYRELLGRVEALPGITAASVSTGMPVMGASFGMPFEIVGKPVADRSQRPGAGFNMVSPGFFETFGIRLTRGRAFTEADVAGGMNVAIVNATLGKKYFSDVDPLTQQISVEQLLPGVTNLGPPVTWQIVGVYENVRNNGPKGDGFPEIDVPFAQSPWPSVSMAVRTTGIPESMNKSIAAVIRSMDPDLPMADVKTMDKLLDENRSGDRFSAALFGTFAAIALLLAAFGIYGVMSFAVAQRTHEIGLRMALGAAPSQVLELILKEGMVLGGIGLVIGFFGAWGAGKLMQGMWYGVGAIDPLAFSTVAIVLMLSALLACYVPARRATQVDPISALRQD
jgi:putative ABC transport system permease protein